MLTINQFSVNDGVHNDPQIRFMIHNFPKSTLCFEDNILKFHYDPMVELSSITQTSGGPNWSPHQTIESLETKLDIGSHGH